MSYAFAGFCGALAMVPGWLLSVAWLQRELRTRTRALREQIGEERIAAADEQARMVAVATAECGHEVAWKMLEAVVQPPRHKLARQILEETSGG